MLYPFFQHVNYTKPLSALEGKLLWRFTSGSRYERRIWRCNRKYDPAGDQPCATKHVTEDELIAAFEQATRQLAPPPSPEVLEAALDQLGDLHALEAKLAQAITAREAVVDEINALIHSAAKTDFDPDAFEADHARLEADYQYHLSAVESLEKQLHELEAKRAAITAFHQYRSENPAISYTPEAWRALVDHATIHPGGTIAIAFNDG